MPPTNRAARIALIALAALYLIPPAVLVLLWALTPLVGEGPAWTRTRDVVEAMGGLPAGFLGALVAYVLQEAAKARVLDEVRVLGRDLSGLAGGTRAQGAAGPVSPEARAILAKYRL